MAHRSPIRAQSLRENYSLSSGEGDNRFLSLRLSRVDTHRIVGYKRLLFLPGGPMVPWPLLLTLVTLGSPNVAPGLELRVRAAVACPRIHCQLGLSINTDGEFVFDGETPSSDVIAHRSLKLRNSRDGGTLPGIEALVAIAGHSALEGSTLGMLFTDAAIGCCRARLRQQPHDASAMVRLGELFDKVRQLTEAERWLRLATWTAPRDWQTWHALARYHWQQVLGPRVAPPQDLPKPDGSYDVSVLKRRIADDGDGHMRQASDCYDWAVIFAPDAPEAYLARFGWLSAFAGLSALQSADANAQQAMGESYLARITADAHAVAELTGHPLAYGLCLIGPAREIIENTPITDPYEKWFWNKAIRRLEPLRSSPDPLTRSDAVLILTLIRCFILHDFAGAKPLLDELPAGDRNLPLLASLVYEGLQEDSALGDFMARKRKLVAANDYFILAKCYEFGGHTTRESEITAAGLQKFPTDARLNLLRTGLLLHYGKPAHLLEVHFRLSALEADFAARQKAFEASAAESGGLTDTDRELLQLVRLHRAFYLALVGQPVAASRLAKDSQCVSSEAAEAAQNIIQILKPSTEGSDNSKPVSR